MLVLHVGRHKCGSSSIQYFMSLNSEKLRELGVLYPMIGRRRHAHHPLAHQTHDKIYTDLNSIIALMTEHPSSHVVVSSEDLCLRPTPIEEIRRRVEGHDVMIVMYIRELSQWLPSKYNQFTSTGMNFLDFDEFYAATNLSQGNQLLYRAAQWAEKFGWENIRVRSLDRRSLTGGTLIDDFLSIFGLTLTDFGGANALGLEPRNASYGWKVLEVLRNQFAQLSLDRENSEVRRHGTGIRMEIVASVRNSVNKVMAELNLDTQKSQYISAPQWRECHEVYRREVEKLNKRLVGPEIPMPDAEVIVERPFLPTIDVIPLEERREITQRLGAGLQATLPQA